jgi:1,4-alpha-glucan branching enzyme
MLERRRVEGTEVVEVTFRLPAEVGAGEAFVVGDFNEWSETAHPMEPSDGGFVATIPLEAGRSYRFRYLVDGDRWENDWAADGYAPNDFGSDDSIVDLTDARADGDVDVDEAPPAPADQPCDSLVELARWIDAAKRLAPTLVDRMRDRLSGRLSGSGQDHP